MSSHFPTGMITQTNVSDTYRYAFSSGDDGYMYIDNVNLSTDEVTRLQFSKNGALDLLTINDGDLNYIGHFISNADISYGNLGAGNFGAVEGRWQKFGQIITFAGLIQSISGASGAWGTLATIPHTSISQIWFRPLLNSTGNEPIVRDGNISGSNITAWLANGDNGKYIFFSGTYVCNN